MPQPNQAPVSRGSAAGNGSATIPGTAVIGDYTVCMILAPSTATGIATPAGFSLLFTVPNVAGAPKGIICWRQRQSGDGASMTAAVSGGTGTTFIFLETWAGPTVEASGFVSAWGGISYARTTTSTLDWADNVGVGVGRPDVAFRGLCVSAHSATATATWTPSSSPVALVENYDAIPQTVFSANITAVADVPDVRTWGVGTGFSSTASNITSKTGDITMYYTINPIVAANPGLSLQLL